MLHRLYIGSDNVSKTLATDTIKAIVSKFFNGFSMNIITGYYMGAEESTALVEIETDDSIRVRELASTLRVSLNQDSVGLVIMPVSMSFV